MSIGSYEGSNSEILRKKHNRRKRKKQICKKKIEEMRTNSSKNYNGQFVIKLDFLMEVFRIRVGTFRIF